MSELHEANPESVTTPATTRGAGLIRRAPSGYLWNQAFSLWQFFSLFLINLVLVRTLSQDQYGIYAIELTVATTALYLMALGLESSGSVFLPRVLADEGPGQAMTVTVQLLVIRTAVIVLVAVGILYGLPALAQTAALAHLPWASGLVSVLDSPLVLNHRGALLLYAAATSAANLLAALLTSILRTRILFICGSIAQLASVGLVFVLVGMFHLGVDGALVALSLPTAAVAVIYVVALLHTIGAPPRRTRAPITRPMMRLGLAAWASDLANGSLLKSITLALMGVFAASATLYVTDSGAFNLTYEMGHAASLLFVAGLGGVGLAVMSVAYAARSLPSLATAWRAVSKLQVVLAVPLVVFCIPHAGPIMRMLYGDNAAGTGTLLMLFLAFNALVRLAGGGAHSAALYVLGYQRWVVITSWAMLGVVAIAGVMLIPRFGVAGALAAVGVAQLAAELGQLVLARHYLAQPYPVGFMFRVLLAMTPATIFAVAWRPTGFAGLFLSGLGYLILFVVALLLLRPLDAEDRALLAEASPVLRRLLLPFTQRAAPVPTTPSAASTASRLTTSPTLRAATRPLPQEASD